MEKQTKNFWERPEGTTGMLTIALAIGGLYFAAPAILGFLTTLTAIVGQSIMLLILGSILVGLLFIITNPKFQNLIGFMFKTAMRAVTQVFIEIDPIGLLKEIVKTMEARKEVVAESKTKLRGQIKKLEQQITDAVKEYNQAMNMAQAARNQGNNAVFEVQSRQAMRLDNLTNETYRPLLNQLNQHYNIADRVLTAVGIHIDDLKNEVKVQEVRRAAILSASSVIKNAKAIMNGNSAERELFDQTIEYLVDDYGNRLGEIEDFIDTTKPYLDGIDIQNGAYQIEAAKRLDAWEQNSLLIKDQRVGNVVSVQQNAKPSYSQLV